MISTVTRELSARPNQRGGKAKGDGMTISNLGPEEVSRMLQDHSILLIDVREPGEYEAEHIQGALLCPLSSLDPETLPVPQNLTVVFQCGSGVRSAKAVNACAATGLPFRHHLQGGIQAWKAAGLPTVSLDPATGRVRTTR
jgi:rhodanese-related sulfurtransferase